MFSLPLLSEPIPSTSVVSNELLGALTVTIIIAILGLFIIALLYAKRELLNNWNILIPNLNYSSKEFYKTLDEQLQEQNIEGLKTKEKSKSVGGILSGKRLYLEISYDDYIYEVCAAPFGNSFFVSYWMSGGQRKLAYALARIPWIGKPLSKIFFPMTYYRVDTSNMFHTLVHELVIELVDDICKEHELEKLSDNQKIPVMNDVFKR